HNSSTRPDASSGVGTGTIRMVVREGSTVASQPVLPSVRASTTTGLAACSSVFGGCTTTGTPGAAIGVGARRPMTTAATPAAIASAVAARQNPALFQIPLRAGCTDGQ